MSLSSVTYERYGCHSEGLALRLRVAHRSPPLNGQDGQRRSGGKRRSPPSLPVRLPEHTALMGISKAALQSDD